MSTLEATLAPGTLALPSGLGRESDRESPGGYRAPRTRLASYTTRVGEFVRGWRPRRLADGERNEYADAAEHIAERRRFVLSQIEYRARADRELHDEARAIAGDLENSLSTLGFDYHFSRDKKRVHKTVHALRYQVTPDEIRVQIDTRPGKLPHGVNTTDMTNPDVIKSLTASIGADIQVHFDRGGLWYRVYRNSGVFGIPSYVKFNDMIAQIGKRDGPLVVAVGVGQGRKVIKANFDNESFCHWLIAGSTGMGKTTLLHSIISQLAMRDPAHIRMVLIDLKRYELKRYRKLPHLEMQITREPLQVLDTVKVVRDEMHRRHALIDTLDSATHIRDYNQIRHDHLPYLFLIIDEIASVMVDPAIPHDYKQTLESYLNDIGRLGRSAGVHMMIGTQTITREVITRNIHMNCVCRVCQYVPNYSDSILVIGDGSAHFDHAVPRGRAIIAHGLKREFQGAYITMEQIDEIVTKAADGQIVMNELPDVWDVTPQEIVAWATKNCPRYDSFAPWEVGSIVLSQAANHFMSRGPDIHWIRWQLEKHHDKDGKEPKPILIDGNEFVLRYCGESNPLRIVNLALKRDIEAQQESEPPKKTVAALTAEQRADNLTCLARFLMTKCQLDPNLWQAAGPLYEGYRAFADECGFGYVSDKIWSQTLKAKGCKREDIVHKRVPVRGWSGIRLIQPATNNDDADREAQTDATPQDTDTDPAVVSG